LTINGQWLYRNIQVHDKVKNVVGTLATLRKEEIQKKIDEQQALGVEGLLEKDCFLVECNLGVTDAPEDERIGR
jgi:hypothetical protein